MLMPNFQMYNENISCEILRKDLPMHATQLSLSKLLLEIVIQSMAKCQFSSRFRQAINALKFLFHLVSTRTISDCRQPLFLNIQVHLLSEYCFVTNFMVFLQYHKISFQFSFAMEFLNGNLRYVYKFLKRLSEVSLYFNNTYRYATALAANYVFARREKKQHTKEIRIK